MDSLTRTTHLGPVFTLSSNSKENKKYPDEPLIAKYGGYADEDQSAVGTAGDDVFTQAQQRATAVS